MTKPKIDELIEAVRNVQEVYKQMYPNANYLSISFLNGRTNITNEYWMSDINFPIHYSHKEGEEK